ncbi:hypothetical protein GH714_015565 [Hevea brasiliensis]|uniref:Uncharacterized protein n=1 Tax=Hevea brasiliensis TaxID=3981 RepID=A0A6A6LL41_HEVBR|nr:hypothetical protein GH714_015565 [Hevea brasiliensis]
MIAVIVYLKQWTDMVESILDKENFTLEELLDEEEIIQECKALNSRLINFIRDRAHVEQLLRYIIEEPPEDAESKRTFKFPFIACEIFTCEIDVVVCLMVRKTVPLMKYVQSHQDVFRQLVDLIGITSIMEVLVRLVGADDHVYPNFIDVMQWLADSNLLEMIVDKLNPSSPPEVHANAAETLCAISRNAPSALATKLSSPSFVSRIFGHALEDSHSKSGLVHSLSRLLMAMLPKLGDLLMLLNVLSDDKILPTTYGELKPPLGKHRLKIVEFIAVLLRTGNEATEKELVSSGTIKRILICSLSKYPFNNALHHHVESIILSCLETKSDTMVDHLLRDCDFIGKILQTDKNPIISGDINQLTVPAAGKRAPRAGNLGHITRISNKLVQLGNTNSRIQTYLQENSEWNEWQASILQERNAVENVYRWACGRPTALQDRTRDSDEDDLHDRDYDVAALANNLSQAFRYKMYGNEDNEEDNGDLDRDDEDVYFDDESAEVVISSLRLGDDQGSSLFTNSNWFAFQDDSVGNAPVSTSPMEMMDEISLNGAANGGNSNSDDEVVVGEDDELTESKDTVNFTSTSKTNFANGFSGSIPIPQSDKATTPQDIGFFRFDTPDNEYLFGDRPFPEWVGWGESSDLQVGGSSLNPFEDHDLSDVNLSDQAEVATPDVNSSSSGESILPNGSSSSKDSSDGSVGSDTSRKSATVPSLFEEDVEFVGVELEGTEKAMEQALKEGIVGEAGPLKRNMIPKVLEKENSDDDGAGIKEFNDANYWRVDQEVAVLE